MANNLLRVPKSLRKVTLWVHPEGRVTGSMFLNKMEDEQEDPIEAINQDQTFIVFQREQPDELRFYNRGSIVRVEYDVDEIPDNVTPLDCRLHMMDGSVIEGRIIEAMPPDHSRLFDYLNQQEARFVKLFVDQTTIYLINKSYINQVLPLDQFSSASQDASA